MVNPKTTEIETEIEIVEPRLVCLRLHGDFTGDEAAVVFDTIEEHVKDEPYFLIETDMTDVASASPEARRISADKLRRLPRRAIAIVSKSFSQRMIAKLVLTAVSMFDGEGRNVTGYFSTSESARDWLRSYAAECDAAIVRDAKDIK